MVLPYGVDVPLHPEGIYLRLKAASRSSCVGRGTSMARAYSQDLQDRVIDAALAGLLVRALSRKL